MVEKVPEPPHLKAAEVARPAALLVRFEMTKKTSTKSSLSDRLRRPPSAPDGEKGARPLTRGQSSRQKDVAEFVEKIRSVAPANHGRRGRLIFAMDATMSRQPTWDMALALQAKMFEAVRDVGGLDVQLVFFRGAGQCQASKWVSDAEALKRLMTTVSCQGGFTQIGKVLSHARREADKKPVNALVYVGDAMEEGIDDVCGRAGELALLGVPVFLFQEGRDQTAESAFREIARLTKGAWCSFDAGSADQLRQLLEAVAVYVAGGRDALLRLSHHGQNKGARRLISQM